MVAAKTYVGFLQYEKEPHVLIAVLLRDGADDVISIDSTMLPLALVRLGRELTLKKTMR